MAAERPVLLSLRPRFADALLNGTKTVEVRRRPMRLDAGTLCLLYASAPIHALTGAIIVASVDHGAPSELWRRHGPRMALTRDEYHDYLDGRSSAGVLVVTAPVTFHAPVPLAELRRRLESFVPPQSYRFVRDGELRALLNGQAAQVTALRSQLPLAV